MFTIAINGLLLNTQSVRQGNFLGDDLHQIFGGNGFLNEAKSAKLHRKIVLFTSGGAEQ